MSPPPPWPAGDLDCCSMTRPCLTWKSSEDGLQGVRHRSEPLGLWCRELDREDPLVEFVPLEHRRRDHAREEIHGQQRSLRFHGRERVVAQGNPMDGGVRGSLAEVSEELVFREQCLCT